MRRRADQIAGRARDASMIAWSLAFWVHRRILVRRFTSAIIEEAGMRIAIVLLFVAVGLFHRAHADPPAANETANGDALVSEYFLHETQMLTDRTFADIKSLEDWTEQKERNRKRLLEMLGLDPLPERSSLDAIRTGQIERDGVIAERIQFQSMPGLYVTGNLYRPVKQEGPLPAILYVCGHGRVHVDGVSLGNKTHYQHHGGWFAKNGYVCLTIDTIQLGEIEGIHHGTYREKMWWWNNRGYTPAGVEAWNCVRSIDYLQTRSEVDGERIGVTGRSGGGAYSWWAAAIDERVKVAVPVAGITSLHNHVVDGCVEGHCDCMYMVNTYRWDYPMVAALVAPRPLLISNTDKDRIFPLDGVVDVHQRVKQIYDLYDASENLGLQITEGPHKDTQELRVHAFRWFNRFLRSDDSLIRSPAEPLFEKRALKVFETLPIDERVSSVHESFVPVTSIELPDSVGSAKQLHDKLVPTIRRKCFGGWPETNNALQVSVTNRRKRGNLEVQLIEFLSQTPYHLPIYRVASVDDTSEVTQLRIVDQPEWDRLQPTLSDALTESSDEQIRNQASWDAIRQSAQRQPIAIFAPRGVGATQWSTDVRARTHIRRRFMQIGQTAAGMQTYDIVRAIHALRELEGTPRKIAIQAADDSATWALFASLFTENIASLELSGLPATNRGAPDLLNVSRFVQPPHVLLMLATRIERIALRNDHHEFETWRDLIGSNPLTKDAIILAELPR